MQPSHSPACRQAGSSSPSFINVAALLLFAVVIAAASSVGTYYLLSSRTTSEPTTAQAPIVPPAQTKMQPPIAQPTTAADETNKQFGFIEGALGYPSEGIPPLEICAENITTQQKFCTQKNIEDKKYTYGKGYKLEVPPGNYYVYATGEGSFGDPVTGKIINAPPYKAYYSEFVTCGFSVNCPSHQPIIVTVTSGQTTDNIDPQDWYKTE